MRASILIFSLLGLVSVCCSFAVISRIPVVFPKSSGGGKNKKNKEKIKSKKNKNAEEILGNSSKNRLPYFREKKYTGEENDTADAQLLGFFLAIIILYMVSNCFKHGPVGSEK